MTSNAERTAVIDAARAYLAAVDVTWSDREWTFDEWREAKGAIIRARRGMREALSALDAAESPWSEEEYADGEVGGGP